ncbi:MAG TPA: hypothetical protein VL334_20870 [Anaerolineae bacterium]|nr:hypothetical protein [Anaerolineae bacterium]
MPSPPPIAAQIYDELAATFEQTYTSSPDQAATLQIGGCLVRLRATTPALHCQVLRPLACPLSTADQTPDFTVDLVDLGEHLLPDLPWLPQNTSREQETSEYQEGPFLFTRHGDVLLTALNQETRRTVGLVQAPARWPLRHYKQAIFITLYQHLRRRGLHLIHASAIGQNGRAALIAGRSGAGKTTTMLTCVAAGLAFLGDDTTLLQRTPAGDIDVISLLSTLDVTDKTAAWFPEIAPFLSPLRSHTGKRQIILSEAYPSRVAVRGQVSAILAPEITDRVHTTLAPANKASLLSDLLFYSVDLQDVALARQHLEFLAQAVEQIPIYRLLLGSDRQQLPRVITEILRA